MNLRRWPPIALAAGALLAGCGGSSASSSSSSASTASTAVTSSALTGSGAPAGPGPSGAAGGPQRGPSGGAGMPGGSINARVPASFTLTSAGKLQPPTVSAPAFVAVQVSVRSSDNRSHTVVIQVPSPRTLHLPAHGQVGMRLPGMRAGHYAIAVDGHPAGALSIGGEPGP